MKSKHVLLLCCLFLGILAILFITSDFYSNDLLSNPTSKESSYSSINGSDPQDTYGQLTEQELKGPPDSLTSNIVQGFDNQIEALTANIPTSISNASLQLNTQASNDNTPVATNSAPKEPRELIHFKAVLKATENLTLHDLPGQLKVWIGGPNADPNISEGMVSESTIVPAGNSATIKPYAPGFKITPSESQCLHIDPVTGSEERFTLTPVKSGDLKVSADIKLFNTPNCSGTPIPKSAATLSVIVTFSWLLEIKIKASELWNTLWSGFLDFWKELVGLAFATLLFLIRKKIKRLFGYDNKNATQG